MKSLLATYLLFIYEQYLEEDYSDITKFGKLILKSLWYIKCLYIAIFAVIGIPLIYAHYQSLYNPKLVKLQKEFDDFLIEILNLNK